MNEIEMGLTLVLALLVGLVIYANSRIRELEHRVKRMDERVEHNYSVARDDYYSIVRRQDKFMEVMDIVVVPQTPERYEVKK